MKPWNKGLFIIALALTVNENDLNRENCWSKFTDVYFVTVCHYFQVKQ